MTGLWVIAHECGHGFSYFPIIIYMYKDIYCNIINSAFSDSELVNDIVGLSLHSFLLVPYFGWKYTHAKHHKYTNHLIHGETHVPATL